MSLYIDGSMITWDPGLGRHVYELTGDVDGGITLAAGLGGVLIDGNNYSVTGSGTYGLNVGTNNPYLEVRDLNITGSFSYGVYGVNSNGSVFDDVDVSNSLLAGYDLTGGSMTIVNATVHNIGGAAFPNKAFGMQIFGSNNTIDTCYVYDINGATESVGVSFSSSNGTGNRVENSTISGAGETGWSFGIWSSNSGVVVAQDVYLHSWDQGAGAIGGVTADHSTFSGVGWMGQVTGINGSVLSENPGQQTGNLTDSTGRNVLVGDDTDQIITGGTGQDTLYGFGGADTFVFTEASGDFDILADFVSGTDRIGIEDSVFPTINLQIGTYAVGSSATFYFDPYEHALYWDPNGFGGAAGIRIANMPGDSLTQSDMVFV
jgi:hypothetical protein